MAQEFYTILTNAGLAYEAQCKANQVPIKLTHMAVGDGNGAVYNPGPDATALRRETHRQAINALLQDEENPTWLNAEAFLPPEVGGWTIREVGIFTDTGILYSIGKYPESVKPVLDAGSSKQFYVTAIFQTSNAAIVNLVVDNTVVMASRAFVLDHVKAELAKLDGKNSVKVATTANLGALSGLLTVDGVTLVSGDRVLVKNQADAKTNGIYAAASGAWARAADADATLEVTPGLLVTVEQGTANADSIWQLVTDGQVTLGTTDLMFEIAAGPTGVAAGTYRSVTVDKRGRVTGGSNPNGTDDYGITDAVYRRNLVVDGACRMAQLPAKALSTSAQYGAVDLFAAWAGGAVTAGSIAQHTSGIGQLGTSLHLSGVTLTGAGGVYARHRIEGAIAREIKNKTASVSVLVQHDVGASINYTLTLRKANALDNFSAVTQIAASTAIAVPSGTATVLRFEGVTMGDCSNGVELEVAGNCGAVAAKNFQFTEWQVEQGAKATRFAGETLAETIQATERYLEKSYDLATMPGSVTMNGATVGDASSVSDLTVNLRVRKRIPPTVTYYSALNGASGTISFSNTQIETSPSGNLAVRFSRASEINLHVESLPGDGYMPIVHFVADARL